LGWKVGYQTCPGYDAGPGSASYNVSDFKPEIVVEDEKVKVSTGNLKIQGSSLE